MLHLSTIGKKVVFIPYDDPPVYMSPIGTKYQKLHRKQALKGVVQAFIVEKFRVKEAIILKGVPNTGLVGGNGGN